MLVVHTGNKLHDLMWYIQNNLNALILMPVGYWFLAILAFIPIDLMVLNSWGFEFVKYMTMITSAGIASLMTVRVVAKDLFAILNYNNEVAKEEVVSEDCSDKKETVRKLISVAVDRLEEVSEISDAKLRGQLTVQYISAIKGLLK